MRAFRGKATRILSISSAATASGGWYRPCSPGEPADALSLSAGAPTPRGY